MKKTLHIDEHLLADARIATGAATDTATVKLGLEALLQKAAYAGLIAYLGSEPDAQDVPRRREDPDESAPEPNINILSQNRAA